MQEHCQQKESFPDHGTLQVEEAAAKIQRIVRGNFRTISQDAVQEISQRVLLKLLNVSREKLTTPYLWTAAYREGISYIEEAKRHSGADVEFDNLSEPFSGPREQEQIPLAVVTERLRIADQSGAIEAIAFGYRTFLGYTPEAIGLNLAALRLEDLALGLLRRYAQAADVPEGRLAAYLPAIHSLIGSPKGDETFQDHWKPEPEVQRWVADVQEAVNQDPSRRGPPDLSPAYGKAPNRRLAFAYASQEGLGSVPARIVSEYGNCKLEFLQTEFEAQYPKRYLPSQLPLDKWKPMVQVFGSAAERELQWYYTPTKTIGRWIDHTREALLSAERKQEKGGLQRIFQFARYSPAEAIAFLYTRHGFLGFDPATVRKKLEDCNLSKIEEDLRSLYQEKWDLEKAHVERWFRPLREELGRKGAGEQRLSECFPTAQSIRNAQEKVFGVIQRWFRNGSEFPLFGWRHRLL